MEIKEIRSKIYWEKFISQYSPASLFQSWNWGEVIEVRSQKSEVRSLWRLGLYDENNLIGIAQIVKVKARRGTFLHIRHGPIFSKWQKEWFEFLLNHIKKIARDEKALFIRISPLIEKSENNQLILKSTGFRDAPIHRMDGEVCWAIDLSAMEDIIFNNMRKTTRYLIRQAQKLGVKIVATKEADKIDDFLKLYDLTANRQHFVKHQGIKEEFKIFLQDNQVVLFQGYSQDILLGAALIIFYNHQAIYHHSASIQQKIPVNYLLQWEAIKEAKIRGKKIYNMWGIADENNPRHPWKGLTLFKKGFGGEKLEYLHTQDLPLSPFYCTTYIIESARKIIKGY